MVNNGRSEKGAMCDGVARARADSARASTGGKAVHGRSLDCGAHPRLAVHGRSACVPAWVKRQAGGACLRARAAHRSGARARAARAGVVVVEEEPSSEEQRSIAFECKSDRSNRVRSAPRRVDVVAMSLEVEAVGGALAPFWVGNSPAAASEGCSYSRPCCFRGRRGGQSVWSARSVWPGSACAEAPRRAEGVPCGESVRHRRSFVTARGAHSARPSYRSRLPSSLTICRSALSKWRSVADGRPRGQRYDASDVLANGYFSRAGGRADQGDDVSPGVLHTMGSEQWCF